MIDHPAPSAARDLCLRLANTAMRLADSLAEFGDDLSASAEWIQALGDAEHALDVALGLNVDELTPPSTPYVLGGAGMAWGPQTALVIEDDEPAPTADRLALLRLHLEKRCSSAPAEVAEVFAEIDALSRELEVPRECHVEQRARAEQAERERDEARAALAAAEQREAGIRDRVNVAERQVRILVQGVNSRTKNTLGVCPLCIEPSAKHRANRRCPLNLALALAAPRPLGPGGRLG